MSSTHQFIPSISRLLQGGPFESAWQTRYAKLYPNRLELHTENNKPQLVFMEDIEDINTELVTVGGAGCCLSFLSVLSLIWLSSVLDKLPPTSGPSTLARQTLQSQHGPASAVEVSGIEINNKWKFFLLKLRMKKKSSLFLFEWNPISWSQWHSDLTETFSLQVRNEQCVILRTKEGKIVLTNSDEIGLKEWSLSLRTTLRCSHELLSGLAKKAGKIYGTDGNCNNSANWYAIMSEVFCSPWFWLLLTGGLRLDRCQFIWQFLWKGASCLYFTYIWY